MIVKDKLADPTCSSSFSRGTTLQISSEAYMLFKDKMEIQIPDLFCSQLEEKVAGGIEHVLSYHD